MLQRWKRSIFEFAWCLSFTGRMIEKTRCTIQNGWQFAKETQEKTFYWFDAKPSDVADFQIKRVLQTMKELNTKEEIDMFVQTSEPGEIAYYGISDEHCRPPRHMIEHANGYMQKNIVQLFQKRQQDGSFHYLIRKAKHK